jgi:hypothetical protein
MCKKLLWLDKFKKIKVDELMKKLLQYIKSRLLHVFNEDSKM